MSKDGLDFLRSTIHHRAPAYQSVPLPYPRAIVSDHVGVRVTGGIGDLILGVGVAESIAELCGATKIYSKWPEIGQLFTTLENRHENAIVKRGLDVIVNINALAIFQFSRNFRGFSTFELADLYVRNQNFLTQGDWPMIADHHPHLDNVMGTEAMKLGLMRDSVTYASLGVDYRPFRRRATVGPSPFKFKYITIHDGHDSNNSFTGQATKNWNMEAWRSFVKIFKHTYPGIKVVQVGGPNSRLIPGIDVNRVRMLPFADSLAILSGSLCHVDGDSGLTHAATVMGVKCVAMYGPSPIKFFGSPENVNLGPRHTCEGNCWWLTYRWSEKCAVGYEACEAMNSISYMEVLQAVKGVLSENEIR